MFLTERVGTKMRAAEIRREGSSEPELRLPARTLVIPGRQTILVYIAY